MSKRAMRCEVAGAIVSLLASAGSAQVIEWASAQDGFWFDAANWNPQNIPDSSAETAVLGQSGPYAVWLQNTVSIRDLEILNPEAVCSLLDGRTLQVHGGLACNGRLIVNVGGTNQTTRVLFNATHEIGGSGEILLNANFNNYDTGYLQTIGNAVVTFGSDVTVRGIGRLYGRYLLDGTILCDDPFGAAIQVNGSSVAASSTGLVRMDGGRFSLQNSSFQGGRIEAAADEAVLILGTSTLRSTTLAADAEVSSGSVLLLDGDNTLENAALTVNLQGGSSGTYMRFEETATLGGVGDIVLNANVNNYDTAYLNTLNNAVVTLEEGITVRGVGRLYGRYVLDGTVLSDGPAGQQVQFIGTQVEGGATGRIELQTGGVYIGSGADVSMVPIEASGGGSLTLGSCSLRGVVLDCDTGTDSGSGVQFGSGMVLERGLTVNRQGGSSGTWVRFNETSTLSGGGEIVLNANFGNYDTAYLSTLNNAVVTIGEDIEIRGVGRLYGRYLLDGTLISDGPADEQIQLPGTELAGGAAGSAELRTGGLYIGSNAVVSMLPIVATGEGWLQLGSCTLSGVLLACETGTDSGSGVQLGAGVVLDGTLTVNRQGGGSGTWVRFNETTTLEGAGEIVLNSNLGNFDTAYLTTLNNAVATIGPEIELRGTGNLYGSLVVRGRVAPETPAVSPTGHIQPRGVLELTDSATLEIEAAGLDDHDILVGSGQRRLGGTLRLILIDNFAPATGDVLTIISGGSTSSTFDDLDLPPGWHVAYGANVVRLVYDCLADFNGDGTVNTSDVLAFLGLWAAADPAADVDGNGTVNTVDFITFLNAWTAGC